MRVIFAGTPAFAAASLDALVQAGHEVVLVLTQPDRPAGRGMRLQPSAVKTRALAHGLAIAQPQGNEKSAQVEALQPMTVASQGSPNPCVETSPR